MPIWKIYGIVAIMGAGFAAPGAATTEASEFPGAPLLPKDQLTGPEDAKRDLLEFQARAAAAKRAQKQTAENLSDHGLHSATQIARIPDYHFVYSAPRVESAAAAAAEEDRQRHAVEVHRSAAHVRQR